MTIPEPSDELVLKVAKEVERVFYEAVDRGDMRGPQAFEHVARAAIEEMPELTELQQRVKQLEEGLHSAKAAIDKTLKAHSAARDMVPDEEEDLAAQVFAYHINGTESLLIKSSEQARSLLSDKGED